VNSKSSHMVQRLGGDASSPVMLNQLSGIHILVCMCMARVCWLRMSARRSEGMSRL
jgi:hypothetical protein